MSFEGEKIFNSAKPLKYVFKPSDTKCNHLVIVFSAFNPKGSKPAYNYMRTLQGLDVNKLFILDDQGERGCYYLGENRIFSVEASVVSLITLIANELNVQHKNIICCGSSKGGYAALYFGIKYGFGHVIAGAPQTYLGNYLNAAKEYPTLEFIAGNVSKESIQFLNRLLYDMVSEAKRVPNICIHVGSGDHHYKGHVLPFKDHLYKNGFVCDLDVKEYSNHGEVSFFQKLMIDKLTEIIPELGSTLRIVSVKVEQNQNKFTIHTVANKQVQFAWYVFKDNERIQVKWYTPENKFNFEANECGSYYFMAFIKNNNGDIVSEKTQQYLVL